MSEKGRKRQIICDHRHLFKPSERQNLTDTGSWSSLIQKTGLKTSFPIGQQLFAWQLMQTFASLLADTRPPWLLPVDWLHLPGDAYYCFGRKLLKFLEKVPDVGPVFQVQVELHYACETCEKSTTVWWGRQQTFNKQTLTDYSECMRTTKAMAAVGGQKKQPWALMWRLRVIEMSSLFLETVPGNVPLAARRPSFCLCLTTSSSDGSPA